MTAVQSPLTPPAVPPSPASPDGALSDEQLEELLRDRACRACRMDYEGDELHHHHCDLQCSGLATLQQLRLMLPPPPPPSPMPPAATWPATTSTDDGSTGARLHVLGPPGESCDYTCSALGDVCSPGIADSPLIAF